MSGGANGNDVSTGRVRAIGTPAVRTESLWKVYEHDGIRVEAVRDVTLTIEQGEFVVLAGPSGSGKRVVFHCQPDQGLPAFQSVSSFRQALPQVR